MLSLLQKFFSSQWFDSSQGFHSWSWTFKAACPEGVALIPDASLFWENSMSFQITKDHPKETIENPIHFLPQKVRIPAHDQFLEHFGTSANRFDSVWLQHVGLRTWRYINVRHFSYSKSVVFCADGSGAPNQVHFIEETFVACLTYLDELYITWLAIGQLARWLA